MEPRHEQQQKALPPGAEQKPRRFRIIKLEERIAPAKGGNASHKQCTDLLCTYTQTCYSCYFRCTVGCGW